MSELSKIAEFMKLLRLWNGLIAALAVLLSVLVAAGWNDIDDSIYEILLGTVIVILFVGAGNSLNDYFDIETDRIAHPNRPLAKGTIPARSALYSAGALFAVSLVLGIFINALSFALVVLAMVAMISYELKMKEAGILGNITIALLVAGVFIFGGSIVDGADKVLILASLAGFATLGREIVKDIEDIEGDKSRITLPKRIGARKASYIAILPISTAVILSPAPYLQEQLTEAYLLMVLFADALFIGGGVLQLRSPRKGQTLFKIAMVVALVAFAVGVPI